MYMPQVLRERVLLSTYNICFVWEINISKIHSYTWTYDAIVNDNSKDLVLLKLSNNIRNWYHRYLMIIYAPLSGSLIEFMFDLMTAMWKSTIFLQKLKKEWKTLDKIGVNLLNDLAYRTILNPEFLDNKTDLRSKGLTIYNVSPWYTCSRSGCWKNLSGILSEYQMVWIQIRTDICWSWSGSKPFAKVISKQQSHR